MRLLFELKEDGLDPNGSVFVRHSARAIIIRDGKVAMVYSQKYDYYKFPGGGMEQGEDPVQAMIRETAEEAGMSVLPESVQEYGYVHRVSKSDHPDADIFLQDNFYYLCEVCADRAQNLDDYEAAERFTPLWVTPETAIETNRFHYHGSTDQTMLEREARVLEQLLSENRLC